MEVDSMHTRMAIIGILLFGEGASGQVFVDVSAATNFNATTTHHANDGAGVYFGDLDNDGDLDAILTGGQHSRLAINHDGGFTISWFGGGSRARQGALIDIDNDGDLDFWHSDERLYENVGYATFTDRGNCGLSGPSQSEAAGAVDVDADGRCDIIQFSPNGNWIGFNAGAGPEWFNETMDGALGLNDHGDKGNGDYCSTGDVNDDGHTDIFYHLDTGCLFLSNGAGGFEHDNRGIVTTHAPNKKVGSSWADYDNDGDLDLFVPAFDEGSRAILYRNEGSTFTEVGAGAGIVDTSGQRSACWGDYDNDGDLDIYVVTRAGKPNVMYENRGNGTFSSVDIGAGVVGDGHDACFADYDGDGDVDLALTFEDAPTVLLENTTDSDNFLNVRVVGDGAGATNAAGIGVRVELFDLDGHLVGRREIGGARGYAGGEPLWAHFGGVDPNETYVIKAYFNTGVAEINVTPAAASSTIGSNTIQGLVTIRESDSLPRLIHWTEVDH
jgi:hypothetical protein